MLRFSTKLYVKETLTAEAFIQMATEWVSKGPHFFFGEVVWDGRDEFVAQCETQKFLILKYDETVAVHLENREGEILWTSDFVLTRVEGRRVVATQLHSEQESYNAKMPTEFHRPILLRMLMLRGYADLDQDLLTSEQPILVEAANASMAARLFREISPYFMPVVYVACAPQAAVEKLECEERQPVKVSLFGGWGTKKKETALVQKTVVVHETGWQLDGKALAERLGGIAHVLIESSQEINIALREQTGGLNPRPGTVQIFYPGGSMQLVTRAEGVDAATFEKEVANTVFRKLILSKVEDCYSWQKIRYHKLAEASRENREVAEICDSLLEEKQAQLDANMEQIEELEAEVSRLRSRLQLFEYHAEAKKSEQADDSLCLHGHEKDFYDKEIHDFVIKTLKKELVAMEGDNDLMESRKYHVLSDLVANNPEGGMAEEIKSQLRQILCSGDNWTRLKKRQLAELGFDVQGDDHYKLVYQGDERYKFVMAKTTSDHRSNLNAVSVIANKLL